MLITRCPKCHYQRRSIDAQVNADICPACGIVYQKWLARQNAVQASATDDSSANPGETAFAAPSAQRYKESIPRLRRWREQLLAVPESTDAGAFWLRVLLLAGFAVWGFTFIVSGVDWISLNSSFLHAVNLPFHEFGHVLFSPFGRFLTILGGSLFQVAMPLGLMLVFVIQKHDNFAGSIMLWWSGQNFIDVSPYIKDAPYRSMPLIGGMGGESHDWGNLLTMMNLLDCATLLANASFTLGSMMIILALYWGARVLLLQKRTLTAH